MRWYFYYLVTAGPSIAILVKQRPDFIFITFSGAISVATSLFIVCALNPHQMNSKWRLTKPLRQKETATFTELMSLPAWALSHLIYFSSPCLSAAERDARFPSRHRLPLPSTSHSAKSSLSARSRSCLCLPLLAPLYQYKEGLTFLNVVLWLQQNPSLSHDSLLRSSINLRWDRAKSAFRDKVMHFSKAQDGMERMAKSIHLSIFDRFIQGRVAGAAVSAEMSRLPWPQDSRET